jgi:hypothetical protein
VNIVQQQNAFSDGGTITELLSDDDAHDATRAAALDYLKGYRRWFGHWIPN